MGGGKQRRTPNNTTLHDVLTAARCLPPQALDPRSGRRYWCQPATGLSSWSRPEGYTTPSDSSGSDSDSSGSDSGSESDSSEGDNGDSKVRPKRVDNASDGNSTSGSSSGSGSDSNDDDDDDVWVPVTPAEKEAKAAGWVRAKDASGEKYYWANPKTGESRCVCVAQSCTNAAAARC